MGIYIDIPFLLCRYNLLFTNSIFSISIWEPQWYFTLLASFGTSGLPLKYFCNLVILKNNCTNKVKWTWRTDFVFCSGTMLMVILLFSGDLRLIEEILKASSSAPELLHFCTLKKRKKVTLSLHSCLLTTSFLTRASLSETISLSSAMTWRSSGRLSLFLNFSSVPSNLDTKTEIH